jgi:hypothetical protein
MEANNIIARLQELKKGIANSQLSVIDTDLIKKQLLDCYELLLSNNQHATSIAENNSNELPTPVQQTEVVAITEKEEINPFVAVIEDEEKPKVIQPTEVQEIKEEKDLDSPLPGMLKKDNAESINEHFEHDGASLNDRFQLSVNKGLNERSSQGDLKKLIDFNRQFVFIQELFNNDATAYMKTIEHLNNSASLEAAFAYLNKEIVHFYKWRPELQSVKLFEKLVRQKFGA